ncbi:MAG: leucine-rich repeat domain-containing protein [Clostridia bacterium]|nr:leucine-rich repeat domain-containing protein [Clostridia bacterium]
MKKQIVFLLMVLCAIFMATAAYASSGTCGENLTWTLENGTLTISGTGDMMDRTVYDWWGTEANSIRRIVVEEGCTSIGRTAFTSTKAEEVTLPSTLKSIHDSAFSKCPNLAHIVIPEGVTYIAPDAFYGAAIYEMTLPSTLRVPEQPDNYWAKLGDAVGDTLEAIHIAPEHPDVCSIDGVVFSADQTRLFYYPDGRQGYLYEIPQGVTAIEDFAFSRCGQLKQVNFPEGLKSIGREAFSFTCIVSLELPEGLELIEECAFADSNIPFITLPSTLRYIENAAFGGNPVLTEITIPANVIYIGAFAFGSCDRLTSATVEGMKVYFEIERFSDGRVRVCFDQDNRNLVIYGHDGSTIQQFAAEYDLAFQVIGSEEIK